MKRVVLFASIVTTIIIIASCSKDNEDNSGQIPVTNENIDGVWYVKSFIKENGTIVDHKIYCNVKRDSIIFYDFNRMNFFTHQNCKLQMKGGCNELILDKPTKRITYCNEIVNGVVSKLTAKEMQIDYDESINLGYLGDPTDCKSIILSRE